MTILLGLICAAWAADKYPVKLDNVNIETVLSNDRVLTNYIKCLLDKGSCTREGRELKSKLISKSILQLKACACAHQFGQQVPLFFSFFYFIYFLINL